MSGPQATKDEALIARAFVLANALRAVVAQSEEGTWKDHAREALAEWDACVSRAAPDS